MNLSTWAVNGYLNALFNNTSLAVAQAYASLHDGYPAETGANEISGGSGPYARVAASFGAAASEQVASDADITFTGLPVATTTPILAVGFWDAATVGNFIGFGWLGALVHMFTGAAATDVITSYGHGLIDTDRVTFHGREGPGLPTGLTEGVLYFVITATTDTFQVSLTSGGAAVNLTADGEGAAIKVVPKQIANLGDSFTVPSGSAIVRGD